MKKKGVYREGQIHVMNNLCDTCIFRPGNLMDLKPGRVESMVREATRKSGCIPCHETIHRQDKRGEAVCRGFYERHATAPLQIAKRLGLIVWQPVAS